MLDVKQATRKAFEHFATLYGGEASGVRLEEVELAEDERYWHVTLSYQPASEVAVIFNKAAFPRDYKMFTIDAQTGEVKSMKIRKVG